MEEIKELENVENANALQLEAVWATPVLFRYITTSLNLSIAVL